MTLPAIFVVSFLYIALKAFQQLNVTLHQPLWVLPTSYLMAITEISLIYQYAEQGLHPDLIAAVGTGSGLGALASMYLHRRLRKGIKTCG